MSGGRSGAGERTDRPVGGPGEDRRGGARGPVHTVTLYTKEGCHLCEQALRVIERVRAELAFELRRCEITSEERIHRAYFDRIPVVEVDGEEVFQYTVSEAGLREALLRGVGRTRPDLPPGPNR